MSTTNTTFRFSLDKKSKKFACPACRQKTFVKYRDHDADKYFPDHVGRCDRENNCGYHFTPKQYFTEQGIQPAETDKKEDAIEPLPPIDFMSVDLVQKSMNGYQSSTFGQYIVSLFGNEAGSALLRKYFVGRSRVDEGRGNIFWRIDIQGNVRTGKIMVYHPGIGKRNKEVHPVWAHNSIKPFNHELCFFGEHLISENPSKTIAVCESEKTAIIASFFFPQFVWVATGGASGCKWREYSVFKIFNGKKVVLFPDFGIYNKKAGRTCYQEWKDRASTIVQRLKCDIQVSTVLEKNIAESERVNDYDLADLLIKRDSSGIAVTDEGYPVIWDYASGIFPDYNPS